MKNITLRILTFAFAVLLAFPLRAQVPQLVNYQGRVTVGGVNFDGTGSFKFALVNTDGTTTYWSNDGTSTIGDEPATAVSLTVAKGLYTVLLGDITVANMAGLTPDIFANPDVRLRVWFDDGVNGSQLLTPDQRLAPSSYLADGAVTSASIASGAVTSSSIAAGAINSTHIAPGSLDFSVLTVPNAPGVGQVLGFDGASLLWTSPIAGGNDGIWTSLGSTTYYGGNVGIGGLPGTSRLTITTPDALTVAGPGGPYITWKDTNTNLSAAISSANGALYFRVPLGAAVKTAGYFDGNGLVVNGRTALSTGGGGGDITFGTPNGESGLTMLGTTRADLRFDGTSFRMLVGPLGGPPLSTSGITVGSSGTVGIGTAPFFTDGLSVAGTGHGPLGGGAIYGSATFGGTGVSGVTDSGTGTYGYSATGDGVIGSSGGSGNGVYGYSASGKAIYAEGNVGQARDKGGLVKALIYVRADGTIVRGFNSFLNGAAASTAPCGFNVQTVTNFGLIVGYVIDFGFRADDRFVSVFTPSGQAVGVQYGQSPSGANQNKIWLSCTNTDLTVILY